MAWISFWSSSAFWERTEYIAELIVIVGAAVEVLTDFKHILKGEENKDTRERVGKYAAIVLIFGLAVELLALARTNHLFDETIVSLTIQARDARTMADGSNTRAEMAFDRATLAQGRADKASNDLETERQKTARFQKEATAAQRSLAIDLAKQQTLTEGAKAEAAKATLELAKLKTPRSLSKEQLDRIRDRVRAFHGTPFDLWVSMDSDSTALMYLIDETLRSAGWTFTAPSIPVNFDNKAIIMASSGVVIEIAEEKRPEMESAASMLTTALILEGIPAVAHANSSDPNKNKSVLHVMIGSKPLN